MLKNTKRIATLCLLGACLALDVLCRPWAVAAVWRQYGEHAAELIARFAKEDTAEMDRLS